MTQIGLLFPHQLFADHPMHHEVDSLYLVEEYLFFKQFEFHKQKIAFHRASMKALERKCIDQKLPIKYIDSFSELSDIRVLIGDLDKKHTDLIIHFIDPTDDWLSRRMKLACEQAKVQTKRYESRLFLNTQSDLSNFFRKDKKRFFQTTFYKDQRKRLNLLLDEDGNPEGGNWTYDGDNRKKYPKGKVPPAIQFPDQSEFWNEAVSYTQKHFADNPGELSDARIYPITHQESSDRLDQFLEYRFHDFGAYEDAIKKEELILNHSILTPMLNTGLISPKTILDRSVKYAEDNNVPINSTEGFVRQIIGWREFMRGMYEAKGTESRTKNYWGFRNKIPACFYDGSTGITPVDDSIKKVLRTGYCHHIERLMILGNFMLLCEFDPDEVYRWFMELFIDAYDWVMVPNVYGMSQFADGGFFATKPYISSSNYVLKMSDYKKGDWQKTWDGLFWRFMDKQRDYFQTNPRSAMLLKTFDKMPSSKQQEHLEHAEAFLSKL